MKDSDKANAFNAITLIGIKLKNTIDELCFQLKQTTAYSHKLEQKLKELEEYNGKETNKKNG